MKHAWILIVLVLAGCLTRVAASPDINAPALAESANAVPGTFTVLSYHEARDDVRDYPDPYAVDSADLVQQFAWLRGNGYTPVSMNQIVAARHGGQPLPPKAVLLSFDDGYLSFYTRVYPLLREFHFPAVLAVVGGWIDHPRGGPLLYGEKSTVPDARFPSWVQIREMADSGLVEVASHTYDLHRGVLANPQGNLEPAATARIYDAATGTYEGDDGWRARVRADLAHNADVIEHETGHRPRVIVWPYGSYNDELIGIATELGMSIALTLDEGANTPDVPMMALRRTLIEHNPVLDEFSTEVRGPLYPEPLRVVQVNLEDVYNADPIQQERNLSALLDRIKLLKPTHVYLQATADTGGHGVADAAYFPNRHLRMRGDLLNRVAWQLATRDDVKVFAVLPVAGFRLSPNEVVDVYEDLARYANIDGLVFDDKQSPNEVEAGDATELTQQIALRVRAFRAPLITVRTLDVQSPSLGKPDAAFAPHHAQAFAAFAAAYDYVALVATPTHENATPFAVWRTALGLDTNAATLVQHKMVFMLQNSSPPETGNLFSRQMRALQLSGVLNFGYLPDDFLHDSPPLKQIAPAMSLRVYPLSLGAVR